MKKSILIIGAGMAGLSAGCYAQMNGYTSQVLELHSLPGGLCTSWSRKGYTFDGCIHWLVGSASGGLMNEFWQEVGALKDQEVVNHTEFMRVQSTDGRTLIMYTDIDRFEKHLLELSPEDQKPIRDMANTVRKLAKFKPPIGKPRELMKTSDGLAMLPKVVPVMDIFRKYGQMTVTEYSSRFKDGLIREALPAMALGIPDFPILAFLMTLSYLTNQNAGYPVGGSLKFAQNVERRYRELGGKIEYKARVEKILVEENRAAGVRLADGREYRADIVISAADGYATLFKMLDGKYNTPEIEGYYKELPIFRPLVQVSLGVKRDLSEQPHHLYRKLSQPITIAGEERNTIVIKHYGYDPTLAPAGKSVVEVIYPCNYAYWKALAQEPERYDAEKKQIALTVLGEIEKVYPGFSGEVEVVDVATPLTYERYTGNWQGSMEGWLLTTKTMGMENTEAGMKKTLPGLDNFFMIGQWVEPGGGLPNAVMSARKALQLICHKDQKSFVASQV
ncbi:MAG: phytoene desaturase family protein [Chloroflexota bacterium]